MALDPRIAGAPQLAPIPIPQVNTAVADGIASVTDALSNAAQIRRKSEADRLEAQRQIALYRQQQREAAEASTGQVAVLQALGQARQTLQASRDAPGTTLDTHARTTADTVATLRQSMMAAFPSERVRQQFAPQIERDVQSVALGEDAWERGQRAKMQGDAGDAVINTATSNIFNGASGATFEAEHGRVKTFLDAVPMDPATRIKVSREVDAKLLRAMSDGLIAQGRYDDARTLAASPQFGAIFGADGVKLTQAQADRGQAEQQAAAQAQVVATKKAAGEHLDALSAMIDQGAIVPDAQLRAATAAAQASGVEPAKIIRFNGLGVTQAINRQFGPAADQDGSKTRAALSALNDVANARPLTSDESVRYDRLIKLSGARRASDADALRPAIGKSAAGDAQVLAQIDKKPMPDRFDTAEKVKAGMGYFQLLGRPRDRQAALQGQFDLKANPDLIKVPGSKGGHVDQFTPSFRGHVGAMTFEMSEPALKGYQSVAEGLYASYLKDAGKTGWQRDLFVRAANVAMGAHQDADGQWRGGMGLVNGRHVMLPDYGSADGVSTLLARADYSKARYADGTAASKDDIVQHYTPVLVSGGGADEPAKYLFRGASGKFLKSADGGDFFQFVRPASR